METWTHCLLPGKLPGNPKDRPIRRELNSVLGTMVNTLQRRASLGFDGTETETRSEFDNSVGEVFVDAGEFAPTCNVIDEPIRIHQALEQREALWHTGLEVGVRYVLSAE
jgi:hypothetical protein